MKNLKILILLSAIIGGSISSVNAQNACLNAALNKPATASSSTTAEVPSRAFDGNLTSNWCSPGFTGWVAVDLQHKFSVDSIKLYVNQAIDGITVHEIKISDDMENWTLAETLSGATFNNQVIKVNFSTPLSNVRGVMINTTSTDSWVAWYEIEVYATLSKPTITQENNVLTSSSTVNNQWYLNGNPIPDATAQTYTVTAPGSYQVGVKNDSECTEVMSDAISLTTGVNEIGIKSIKILPNPAKDNVIIEGASKGTIEILTLQGQLIKHVNVSENKTSINIANLTDGVYSLKITTSEGTIVKKLLKQ